jgi:hypothetical protein
MDKLLIELLYHLNMILRRFDRPLSLTVDLDKAIDAPVYFMIDVFQLLLLPGYLLFHRRSLFLFHYRIIIIQSLASPLELNQIAI